MLTTIQVNKNIQIFNVHTNIPIDETIIWMTDNENKERSSTFTS